MFTALSIYYPPKVSYRRVFCVLNYYIYNERELYKNYNKKTDAVTASVFLLSILLNQYMPPMSPPAGAAGAGGWGISVTADSVVSRVDAIDAAF